MDESLHQTQTPEESAAEDAAFAAAFVETRGETPEPVVEETPAPVETPEPVVEETPAPVETPAEETPAPVVAAGLTEDQLATALSRISQQQGTIDKLGGRLGQLMQQVEKLKEQPRTAAEQRSFDLKFERLQEAFPELAEMLREDLKSISTAPATEQPPTQTFTAEDVDKIVNAKLQTFQKQQEVGFEVRALGAAHPDWEQVIRTPQFALWRDNVIEDGKALMESENAQFISLKLTQFKDWVKSTTSPTHQQAPAPQIVQRANPRLANAVLPRGVQVQASGPATEEDMFAAAFANERKKSGY